MWEKIFERAFLLHTLPRPQIIIHRQFQTGLLAVEISKVGGWDISHVGWLVPIVYFPQAGVGKADGRWRRLYVGKQILRLNPEDRLGSIEIRPKLWIPDIDIKIWENTSFAEESNTDTQSILDSIALLQRSIDEIDFNV